MIQDFWSTIAENVSIHRSNIIRMQETSSLSENGLVVLSDVLFCGSGWSQHYPFFSKKQVVGFGLPHDPEDDKDSYQKWTSLLDAADQQVLMQFRALADPPTISDIRIQAQGSTTASHRSMVTLSPFLDISYCPTLSATPKLRQSGPQHTLTRK